MKKIIFASLIAFSTLSLFAFQLIQERTAKVEQMEGINVFIHSKPVDDYEFLGTVKHNGLVMSVKAGDVLPGLIKRVKKHYPNADGVIVTGDDMQEGEAIRFK